MIIGWLCGLRSGRVTVPITVTGAWKWNVRPDGFTPTWIVIHHSFSSDGVTRDYNAIRKYHMSYRHNGDIITKDQYDYLVSEGATKGLEKPWTNIGYHFVVEKIGENVEVIGGRAIGEVGAHCRWFNDKSIGICIIGNYDSVAPDSDRLFTATSLVRQLCREFSIPNDQVIGHRESYPILKVPVEKSCPGTLFDMDKFRAQVKGVTV